MVNKMTVKFEFVLEDADAENLIRAVQTSAGIEDENILDCLLRTDLTDEQKTSYIQSCQASKKYILGLIDKMTNTRVDP
jgi:hypothetical protein